MHLNNLFNNNTKALADITSYLDQFDTSSLINLDALFFEIILNVTIPSDGIMYLGTGIISLVYYLGLICSNLITFVGIMCNSLIFHNLVGVLLYIFLIWRNWQAISNIMVKGFEIIIKCIFYSPLESLYFLVLLFYIFVVITNTINVSWCIANILFDFSSSIIKTMDMSTANGFIINYNCELSQATDLTNIFSINILIPHYLLDDFSLLDYSFMDDNLGAGPSNASNIVLPNTNLWLCSASGNPDPNVTARWTDFDHFINSLTPCNVPKSADLMPYLFDNETRESLNELIKVRAINVAEDNPWVNRLELGRIMYRGKDRFSHKFIAFMLDHYTEGVSPLTNSSLAMKNLKKSVIDHLITEQLSLAYSHNPPLTDSLLINRPFTIDRDEYYQKAWLSIVNLELNQLRGNPVDPTNQAKHDFIRHVHNISSSPLPDRFTRDSLFAELHSKIFTGSTGTPSLLTKQLTINHSPILQQVYRR